MKDRLLLTGVVGTVMAVLCRFTSVLVVVPGTVGLPAMLGRLNTVLQPALAIPAGLAAFVLVRRRWRVS